MNDTADVTGHTGISHHHAGVYALVSGLAVGIALAMLLLIVIPSDIFFHWRHMVWNYLTGEPVLFLKKQELSEMYMIPYIHLKDPGYVVIVYADALDTPGVEGDVAGQSRYLSAGTYKNELIPITQMHPERAYFACLHEGTPNALSGSRLDSSKSVICERASGK